MAFRTQDKDDILPESYEKDKRAFSISEAAKYACVSRATLHNWVVSGIIPFEELPGRGDGSHKFRLIRKIDIDEFLNQHYHKSYENSKNEKSHDLILLPKGA